MEEELALKWNYTKMPDESYLVKDIEGRIVTMFHDEELTKHIIGLHNNNLPKKHPDECGCMYCN